MKRRFFLKLAAIAAAVIVLPKAALTARPAADLYWLDGFPRPYKLANGDEWWEQHGVDGPTGKKAGAIYAKRSDGEIFFAMMLVNPNDDPSHTVQQTIIWINQFERCACRVKVPCEQHANFLGQGSGAVSEYGMMPPLPRG